MDHIKKVYVVHKTHLDIGFTDFSRNVLDHYVNVFIPKAIETAYEVNLPHMPKQFVWTVGSYLIKYYLEHAEETAKERLEQAIRDGYVEWHLLPCTTHTELMDADLFNYGIEMGKALDRKYGKTHFAAKLTDVPGVTHAAVPYLEKGGIKYLHIGINGASKEVKVPPLCRFQYKDSEVILNYAANYGESCLFKDIALEFAHTSDNMGPPDASCVRKEMSRLREKYPEAQIVSGSLEDFAGEIIPYKDELPVINCEMGDTWIHGVASDPFKTAVFCDLKAIRKSWLEERPEAVSTKEYDTFMENMLLVCEHTWGLDSKKYLHDYENWDKDDFLRAKQRDKTDGGNLKKGGPAIEALITKEVQNIGKSNLEGSYSEMELSWKEQRDYLEKAEKQLPEHLYHEMQKRREKLKPCERESGFEQIERSLDFLQKPLEICGWSLTVSQDGSLRILGKDGNRFHNTVLGLLRYETYDGDTVYHCYHNYNRNLEKEGAWAEPDFAKPGIYNAKTAQKNTFDFQAEHIDMQKEKIVVYLRGNDKACEWFGCPGRAKIIYTLEKDCIRVTIEWFEKSCHKMPEAVYFGFQFDEYENVTLTKLGLPVDASDILEGGSRKLHAIEAISAKTWEIVPAHSPLVSLGGRAVYDCGDTVTDWSEGIHFILQNNRWNTNFPLWYGENASFDYVIKITDLYRKDGHTDVPKI